MIFPQHYHSAISIINNAYNCGDFGYMVTEAYKAGYDVGYNSLDDVNPYTHGTLDWAMWIEGEYSGHCDD